MPIRRWFIEQRALDRRVRNEALSLLNSEGPEAVFTASRRWWLACEMDDLEAERFWFRVKKSIAVRYRMSGLGLGMSETSEVGKA